MLCENETESELRTLKRNIESKIIYHRVNADNSLKWHNFLGLLGVGINALQVLTLGILTTVHIEEVPIVIVSSSFVFLSVIVGRIQNSYNFNVLNVLHNQIADDLMAISAANFYEIKHDSFGAAQQAYLAIIERSHIQEVASCCY